MNPRPVHLYVFDSYVDFESSYAVAHINNPAFQREPGKYEVRTVAASDQPVTTLGGLTVQPAATLDEVTPETSAMLILSGSTTWDDDWTVHAPVLAKAKELLAAGVPVAAICGATYGLANAGLLDDRAHTSNAGEYLAASGYPGAASYRDEDAVNDRGLITAGAMHPVAFAREIFAALDLYEPETLAAWYGLYSTGDPKYFYGLAGA